MSRSWTPEELEKASKAMIASGYMSYEEFCEAMSNGYFTVTAPSGALTDGEEPKEVDIGKKEKPPTRSLCGSL